MTELECKQREQFRRNLDYLMRRRKVRQKHLAQQLGITRSKVSSWMLIEGTTTPSFANLVWLADFFEVSVDALLRGDLTEAKEVLVTEHALSAAVSDLEESLQRFSGKMDEQLMQLWETKQFINHQIGHFNKTIKI